MCGVGIGTALEGAMAGVGSFGPFCIADVAGVSVGLEGSPGFCTPPEDEPGSPGNLPKSGCDDFSAGGRIVEACGLG